MNIDIKFHETENYLDFKYQGELVFNKELLKDQSMLQALQKYNCSKVLLDIRELDVTISVFDRRAVGEYFANLTHSPVKIKVAVLAQVGLIDGFVEIVAKNCGALFEVFTDKWTAIDWLSKN